MRPRFRELEAHFDAMDLMPLRTLCAFCGWSCEGSALECREKALQHRSEAHADMDLTPTKRKRNQLRRFRQPQMRKAEAEEVYAERDKRAKLIGIEITD